MEVLRDKFKEVLYATGPIVLIVILLYFTVAPMPIDYILRFLLGAFFIIIGLSIFLFGVDIGLTPIGDHIGTALPRPNKIWIVIAGGLILGFFVNIAEPDLRILGSQIEAVTGGILTSTTILVVASVGTAIMLALGLLRIVWNFPLYITLAIIYAIIGLFSVFVPPDFLAIAFDASGATTGAIAVPFVLALSAGLSSMKKDGKASEEDSFGLVAITSCGAILTVLVMGLASGIDGLTGSLPPEDPSRTGVIAPFGFYLVDMFKDALIAILPIVIIFLIAQIIMLKLSKKTFKKILKGLVYTIIGLALFLTGVNAGFMEVGSRIGEILGMGGKVVLIAVAFVVGLFTVLAEPAVHVLTRQIETVTAGFIKHTIVIAALALGVGFAVALAVIRIMVDDIMLWHYLLPGYALSIALMFAVPKLFVGIAFDAGGVATGPMTAAFILAFSQGVASAASGGEMLLSDAFGMIALVGMMPIITLQILGLIVKLMSKKSGVINDV